MISLLVSLVTLVSTFNAPGPNGPALKNGSYHAALQRKDGKEIVFNFTVKDSLGKKILYVENAGERLLVDDIKPVGDSLSIKLPFFESELRAAVTAGGNLEGVWLKRGADAYQVLGFKATYNEKQRFPGATPKAATGLTGRWKAEFGSPNGKKTSILIGEFVGRDNGLVTGTFLDPTGDYRYLEGVLDGDSLRLSCFDGGHAYLFAAKVNGERIDGGHYYAGGAGYETWTAVKDASATLPDEFSLTKWDESKAGPVKFSYKDLDGKTVSLTDKRFKNKVVILQILGSWCPNCMDETGYLSKFYDRYRRQGVEIIGLAYERSTDFVRSSTSLRSFQRRFQVKYPILITGVTVGDPQRTSKTLPQLEEIVGFPTTIFLNRKGGIAKIHTGFSGPGTGEHYIQQQQEIEATVKKLLEE